MKKAPFLTICSVVACWFFVATVFAENPVVQTNYTPDPAPMVYNDTVFLYTGQDEDDATGFKMFNYLLYTSTDLVNWRDHGVVASLKSFTWAPDNGAWAAQCVHRNGKFYYYVSIHGKGLGVLVADSPYGPFKDPLGKPLFFHNWNDIDPTVFIDDDDQAVFYGSLGDQGQINQYRVSENAYYVSGAHTTDQFVGVASGSNVVRHDVYRKRREEWK